MNTHYKTCNFSKEKNPGKAFVQSLLYKNSKVKGKATIVSGAAIKRHLDDAVKYIQSNDSIIDIVEINPDELSKIIYNYSELDSTYKNISFRLSDIADVISLGRFVDADLTSNIRTCLPVFKTLFKRMYSGDSSLYHNLICTYSLRDNSEYNLSISKILMEIGVTNSSADLKKRGSLSLPSLSSFKNEFYNIQLYQNFYKQGYKFEIINIIYNSGNGPMNSLFIQWKKEKYYE